MVRTSIPGLTVAASWPLPPDELCACAALPGRAGGAQGPVSDRTQDCYFHGRAECPGTNPWLPPWVALAVRPGVYYDPLEHRSPTLAEAPAGFHDTGPARLAVASRLLFITGERRHSTFLRGTHPLVPGTCGTPDARIHEDPGATRRPTEDGIHFCVFECPIEFLAHQLRHVSLDVGVSTCTHCFVDHSGNQGFVDTDVTVRAHVCMVHSAVEEGTTRGAVAAASLACKRCRWPRHGAKPLLRGGTVAPVLPHPGPPAESISVRAAGGRAMASWVARAAPRPRVIFARSFRRTTHSAGWPPPSAIAAPRVSAAQTSESSPSSGWEAWSTTGVASPMSKTSPRGVSAAEGPD